MEPLLAPRPNTHDCAGRQGEREGRSELQGIESAGSRYRAACASCRHACAVMEAAELDVGIIGRERVRVA